MIVCVNQYEVPEDQALAFIAAFAAVIERLRTKDGFEQVRLHRSANGSGKFMTYAQWASLEDQKAAGKDAALAPLMRAVLAIARPTAEWFELVLEIQAPA